MLIRIYFISGSTGFTFPTWRGFPSLEIAAPPSAPKTWFLGNGFPLDTDSDQDTNGDGVSLLMAYALNLNPNDHLTNQLPTVVLDSEKMSLSYFATSDGIVYKVETSTDFVDWIPEGVILSPLDPDGRRTASVNRSSSKRFLRLVVTAERER